MAVHSRRLAFNVADVFYRVMDLALKYLRFMKNTPEALHTSTGSPPPNIPSEICSFPTGSCPREALGKVLSIWGLQAALLQAVCTPPALQIKPGTGQRVPLFSSLPSLDAPTPP